MPRSRLIVYILLAGAAVLCTVLGVWQTRRLFERRAVNALALARRDLPAVALPSGLPDDSLVERRVTFRGRPDPARRFILRGHVFKEIPGIHVVTPIVPDSGPAVLVLEGFVPAMNGLVPDAPLSADTGVVEIRGLGRPVPEIGAQGEPLVRPEGTSWRYLDFGAVRTSLPYPARQLVVHREGPDTGWPRAVPERSLDDGPHMNYLIQWYAMAVISVATLGVLLFRKAPPPAP